MTTPQSNRLLALMDSLTPERRSQLMSRVGQKNTAPELIVRRIAHSLGYRFRLHRRELPGTPDLVFPRLRKAIFVHGCFWHRHLGCRLASTPKSRSEFWEPKFVANVERDRLKEEQLRAAGWGVLVIWECETRDPRQLAERLQSDFYSDKIASGCDSSKARENRRLQDRQPVQSSKIRRTTSNK